jgi:hypothetical protein
MDNLKIIGIYPVYIILGMVGGFAFHWFSSFLFLFLSFIFGFTLKNFPPRDMSSGILMLIGSGIGGLIIGVLKKKWWGAIIGGIIVILIVFTIYFVE